MSFTFKLGFEVSQRAVAVALKNASGAGFDEVALSVVGRADLRPV